jgi:predicted metal-dependent hydrolase
MMVVSGIEVELVRKNIKNLHLAVYPPDGRVRLAAPLDVNDNTLQLYVTSKIPWIRKQQRKFASIDRLSERKFIDRESHYYLGRRYLLRVHPIGGVHRFPEVVCTTRTYIDMYVREGWSTDQRATLLKEWYRKQLKSIVTELVLKWEAVLGVKSHNIKVQTMRTKWGSCNTENGNILFNIELAKKPYDCIEYVVVHELLHLLERNHNERFRAYLDQYVPSWRSISETLQGKVL